MADKLRFIGEGLKHRLKDMADGTHAPVVYVANPVVVGAALPANILMGIVGAKRVNAQAASARVQLATSGIVGVSITAVGAAIRYALGDGTVTASATDHYLPEGQSRDFRVATSQYIAAIRAGDTDGTLEITELSA